MEKETPYEKLKRETDELETDKLNRIDKGMYEASGGTPTECPDCKCTNLVSDQCKGECLCHHPELTPTEEWEKNNLIEHNGNYYVRCEAHEEVVRRLQEKHKEALLSHDAELARKIEAFREEPHKSSEVTFGDTQYNNHAVVYGKNLVVDAVLALLGTKK